MQLQLFIATGDGGAGVAAIAEKVQGPGVAAVNFNAAETGIQFLCFDQ